MGVRYVLEVICPECSHCDKDVYFAPTCGITEWECPKCKHKVNLYEYAGISYEAASNTDIIADICQSFNTKTNQREDYKCLK